MEESFHHHTERLIEEESESNSIEDTTDDSVNPLCCGVKHIIEMFPPPSLKKSDPQEGIRTPIGNQSRSSNIEKACRYKDPYMQEVNRLMFCSTMGHPPNGSPEYFKAAENYALYGKEFLDFPTDIKFPQPMDVSCFGDVSSNPGALAKFQYPSGIGVPVAKCTNMTTPTVPQQSVLVNQPNYCNFPFFQSTNIVQPLIYSNPFLVSQYLNMFVRETQFNTSIVQQQQFLTAGINERMVYAQMLQQQVQTNQAALMGCCLVRSEAAPARTKSPQEMTYAMPSNGKNIKDSYDSNATTSDKCDLCKDLTLEE